MGFVGDQGESSASQERRDDGPSAGGGAPIAGAPKFAGGADKGSDLVDLNRYSAEQLQLMYGKLNIDLARKVVVASVNKAFYAVIGYEHQVKKLKSAFGIKLGDGWADKVIAEWKRLQDVEKTIATLEADLKAQGVDFDERLKAKDILLATAEAAKQTLTKEVAERKGEVEQARLATLGMQKKMEDREKALASENRSLKEQLRILGQDNDNIMQLASDLPKYASKVEAFVERFRRDLNTKLAPIQSAVEVCAERETSIEEMNYQLFDFSAAMQEVLPYMPPPPRPPSPPAVPFGRRHPAYSGETSEPENAETVDDVDDVKMEGDTGTTLGLITQSLGQGGERTTGDKVISDLVASDPTHAEVVPASDTDGATAGNSSGLAEEGPEEDVLDPLGITAKELPAVKSPSRSSPQRPE